MMKTATIEEALSWGPCYDEAHIRELAGDKAEWTLLDILDHPNVSAEDKCWLVLRPHFFSDADLRMMAAAFAEQQLHIFEREYPDDTRPREAIKAARLFALGEITLDDLRAARDARAAAWDAAWGAASDAARAAAWDAQLEIVKIYARAQ
jgi:hypothetical protein